MKNNNWAFWLIVLAIFTPLTFGMVIPIIVFVALIKSFTNSSKSTTGSARSHRSQSRSKPATSSRRIRFNAQDARLVDEKLQHYFRSNEKLAILDNIFLKPEKGEYTTLKELYIYMDKDCIASLDEFGLNYTELYNDVMKMILKFAKSDVSVRSQEKETCEEEAFVQSQKEEPVINAEMYIEKINQLNTEINNEEITNGLYQTSALLKHIAMIEKKFPDNRDKLNKLYQYYLPILLDILENYKNLNSSAQNHEEFKKSEDRLNKTIILINEAMKTISASLCEEDFLNLSADMSTLEALLKKDGLVKEGTLSAVKMKGESHV